MKQVLFDPDSFLQGLFGLNGKDIVLTGGNGFLGTEYAEAIIRAGGRVAIFDLADGFNDRLRKLSEQNFPIKFFKVDVTDELQVEMALNQVCELWGVPDALINNAGWAGKLTDSGEAFLPSEHYPIEIWDDILKNNLTSTMVCSKVVASRLINAGRAGVIVNIGSTYGLVASDQRIYEYHFKKTGRKFFKPAAYGASKAAIINLTKHLAAEWATYGIRVVALCPGGVERSTEEDPDFAKAYADRVPLGRKARPDEYNGAILFLLSDAAS